MREFWQTVSDFCGIKWLDRGTGSAYTPPRPSPTLGPEPGMGGTEIGQRGVRDRGQGRGGAMTDALWFEGAKLNFAHNLMPLPTDDEVC